MKKRTQQDWGLRGMFIQSLILIGFVFATLIAVMFLGESRIFGLLYFVGLIPIVAYGFGAYSAVLWLGNIGSIKDAINLIKGVNIDTESSDSA